MDIDIKFESICADFTVKQNSIFDIKNDCKYEYECEYECEDTCIIWNNIKFYGVPFGLSDIQMSSVCDRNYNKVIKIGELFGCLILCKQMIKDGYDPLDECDGESADLEYTVSALQDEKGPLNYENGDPEQDVYYIRELKMEKGYDDILLKNSIIEKLPYLIFYFLHVAPDILAFYPEPLQYEFNKETEEKHNMLRNIAAAKINLSTGHYDNDEQKDKNVIDISSNYHLTEDEINIIMNKRNSDSSYPEEAKNKKEFTFYKANGFKEMGKSRLLYKKLNVL